MNTAPQHSTRISKRFAELRARGRIGIVAYITAGDPTLDATLEFVLALAEAGADVIELGVPFSDPLADGPTIQRASERALKSGASLHGVLELVRRIRKSSQVPLLLFSYFNPVLQIGLEKFAAAAAETGADGVLDHRSHAGRVRGLSPHPAKRWPRHDFSGGAHLHRRAAAENCGVFFRVSLSHLPHRRNRREGCLARRSARALATRAQLYATSHRGRLRNFAAGPRFRTRWPCGCCRRRLSSGFGN